MSNGAPVAAGSGPAARAGEGAGGYRIAGSWPWVEMRLASPLGFVLFPTLAHGSSCT